MSTHIPLRIARAPAHPMRRQCLFQRRAVPSTPRCVVASSARAFSSTPARPRERPRLADVTMQMAGAQNTVFNQEAPNKESTDKQEDAQLAMDDMGILRATMVRPPFSKLPSPTSWEFYSYFWSLIKSKFTGVYSRADYTRCISKKGIASWKPADFMKQRELKNKAKKLYKRYYDALAIGDIKTIRSICLTPFAASSRLQIAARGPVKTSWQLYKFKSARIVSHRATPLGEEVPNSSYRQCIVRLESEQQLSVIPISPSATKSKVRAPKWVPASAKAKQDDVQQSVEVKEKGKIETVVEYVVMQKRVMDGKEDNDWKLWGFTSETTPAKLQEDDDYWKKMVDVQAASV